MAGSAPKTVLAATVVEASRVPRPLPVVMAALGTGGTAAVPMAKVVRVGAVATEEDREVPYEAGEAVPVRVLHPRGGRDVEVAARAPTLPVEA